jgi:hypothetical protein
VFVNGKMSLQITQAVDGNSNPPIPPERFSSPYAGLVVTNQLEDMTVILVLILELQPGGVLNVTYNVHLTYDNDSGEDTARGEF